MQDKRMVYWVADTSYVEGHGWRVSVVIEGQPGHQPTGDWPPSNPLTDRSPYFYGEDLEKARERCYVQNDRMGISREETDQIVHSSFRAQALAERTPEQIAQEIFERADARAEDVDAPRPLTKREIIVVEELRSAHSAVMDMLGLAPEESGRVTIHFDFYSPKTQVVDEGERGELFSVYARLPARDRRRTEERIHGAGETLTEMLVDLRDRLESRQKR